MEKEDILGIGIPVPVGSHIIKEIELQLNKQQTKTIATLLPDAILSIGNDDKPTIKQYVGVLLFADVSGFTSLCEKYATNGKGGIYGLTATLNGYIGAIVEVILSFGGDVSKFSGDAFLAIWKVEKNDNMFKVIHNAIVCALFIQTALQTFETDVDVLLRVKLAISCGNVKFAVIGDTKNSHYVLVGQPVLDVKDAEHNSVAGDVILSPSAWGHCSAERYKHVFTKSKHIKILSVIYTPNEANMQTFYNKKMNDVNELIEKHLEHCNRIRMSLRRTTNNSEMDSAITEAFMESLPDRLLVKECCEQWKTKNLRPFIIKPVMQQIDERQPLEYLTEMREVTVLFVNIKPSSYEDYQLISLTDKAYHIACFNVRKHIGCVNKISLFDKDIMILIVFGLRGIKHEMESQYALKSAYEIKLALGAIGGVDSVSVGVTSGLVYCGVVGHPLRREYTVIGGTVNKAARIMCAYKGKVTCDEKTYKYSKLSSCYFNLQSHIALKGIQAVGNIFEYNENFLERIKETKPLLPILGREMEINLVKKILQYKENKDCNSIIFCGESKIGKTRLMQEILETANNKNIYTSSFFLTKHEVLPYSNLLSLYENLYNTTNTLKVYEKTRSSLSTESLFGNVPSDIWVMKQLLQSNVKDEEKKERLFEIFLRLINKIPFCLFIIDNLQLIDNFSWKVLSNVLKQSNVKMTASLLIEKETIIFPEFLKDLTNDPNIDKIILKGIDGQYVAALACQFLKVKAIPENLELLLRTSSQGRPGWIQSCLLQLINNESIEIIHISEKTKINMTVYPSSKSVSYNVDQNDVPNNNNDEIYSNLVSVAILGNKFNMHEEDKTLADISLDLFDSFTPHQQQIVKVGSVLGDMFTQQVLRQMLRGTPLLVFLRAIKFLIEKDILECGTKYASVKKYYHSSSDDMISITQLCVCYFDAQDETQQEIIYKKYNLPKHAFCKLLRFKNYHIKVVAYELLPSNQKKEFHSKAVDILEHQENICPSCTPNSTVFRIQKYNDFLALFELSSICNLKKLKSGKSINQDNNSSDHQFEALQNILKKHVYEKPQFYCTASKQLATVGRIWNPETCSCGQVLHKVYTNLVRHSACAEILGKQIYFLIQQGVVLIATCNYDDAMKCLTEAGELCLADRNETNPNLSSTLRKIFLGKIFTLLGHINIELYQFKEANVNLVNALKQYNLSLTSMKYHESFLLVSACIDWYNDKYPFSYQKSTSCWNAEIGRCLFFVSILLTKEGDFSLAKAAARKSIILLKSAKNNFFMLCDAYTNAIDVYRWQDTKKYCQLLENSANKIFFQKYLTQNETLELLSIGRLLESLFTSRFLKGEITQSIRLGYRALELNTKIFANYTSIHIMVILIYSLIASQKIYEAVMILRQLHQMRQSRYHEAVLWYFALCIELQLDTGVTLETFYLCRRFVSDYFLSKNIKDQNNISNTEVEKKIIVNIYLHYCREGKWADAVEWKTQLNMNANKVHTVHFASTLLKYAECMLLTYVKECNIDSHSSKIRMIRNKIDKILKICKEYADMWIVFMSRYLHLSAYYKMIHKRKTKAKKLLEKAEGFAEKHRNLMELAWIKLSMNVWFGTRTVYETFWIESSDRIKKWNAAENYTFEDWQHIIYPLPLPHS